MAEKPTTPISSPRASRSHESPATPPSDRKRSHRLSGYLTTPDQKLEKHNLPYTPTRNRASAVTPSSAAAGVSNSAAAAAAKAGSATSGANVGLSNPQAQSPNYSHNLLKTPRYTNGYDSDEEDASRFKLQKTPTYFSPGRKLFADENHSADGKKDELNEITLQLKGKLSNAIHKLNSQQKTGKSPYKFDFTELKLDESPTKKIKSSIEKNLLNDLSRDLSKDLDGHSNDDPFRRVNQSLQNLHGQVSPGLGLNASAFKNSPLQGSPTITERSNRLMNLPSPDEESSAHNALMATLSRQQHQSHHQQSHPKLSPLKTPKSSSRPLSLDSSTKYKLPPINVALNEKSYGSPGRPQISPTVPNSAASSSNGAGPAPHNEQDAVFSLMSLSSPQSVKFTHSRTQSLNNNSPVSSRSSSVVLPHGEHMPSTQQNQSKHQSLPPISGLIHGHKEPMLSPKNDKNDKNDNDETDIEDDMTDDDTK